MAKKEKKVWSPEYKYETLEGTFVDFRGDERDFTMVAVSIPMDEDMFVMKQAEISDEEFDELWDEDANDFVLDPDSFVDEFDTVSKVLSIGVSVRSKADKKIEGLGTRIAYGKACTLFNHALYVNDSGMINTEMVKALLSQEAKYFKQDPGHFLKGYNNDKKRYEEHALEDPEPVDSCMATTSDSEIKTRVFAQTATRNLKDKLFSEATSTTEINVAK